MESRRVHAVRFVPKDMSCHFISFDSDVPLATRVEFISVAGASLARDADTPCVVELRSVTSETHPAFGQLALHAKVQIPSKAILVPYTGVIKVCKSITSSRTYAMGFGSVNDDLVIDAEFAGGLARFANDPRNTGRGANAIAESRISALGEYFTALVAKRQIAEGEEILMDYGKAFAFDPLPWIVDGEHVTRPRLRGALPVPNIGCLLRECSVCGSFQRDEGPSLKCDCCMSISTPQHARRVLSTSGPPPSEVGAAQTETQRWPHSIVFLSWQCWDPLIPVQQVSPHIEFRQQDNIKLYDTQGVDTHVVTTKSFTSEQTICFVGGIATLRHAQTSKNSDNTLRIVPLHSLFQLDRPLHLIVTNESQHVTLVHSSERSAANTALMAMRTSFGCPYVALVATRAVSAFERLMLVDPFDTC
jgi:hypothetical protein